MLCGEKEREGRGGGGTKEKARDEKQGDRGDSDKEGDEEGREMKLKSDDIKGRRDIFYDDFEPL